MCFHLKIIWMHLIICAGNSCLLQNAQLDLSVAECPSGAPQNLEATSWERTSLVPSVPESSVLQERAELVGARLATPFLASASLRCGGGVRWGGASGEPTLWVSLFEKGAHKQTLHGWLTVCPWQLVICHRWAAFSGGNVINFTLPSSEISPINHPRLGPCAGSRCRPAWQIFTWFLCPQAPRGYRRRERTSNRRLGRDTLTWWQARRIIRKWDGWLAHVINKY